VFHGALEYPSTASVQGHQTLELPHRELRVIAVLTVDLDVASLLNPISDGMSVDLGR
jgi:hypothetical protein